MDDANRTGGICNIPSSDYSPFTLEAELIINPFLGNNNSPTYTVPPRISDAIGVIEYYNPLTVETDGDSLYYQLISPLGASGYSNPVSSTSFTIDSNTGIITWDAPVMICQYSFAVKTSEWRNIGGIRYYIGYTMQEGWNQNGCATGVSENSTENTVVTIFPNPASDLINFSITNTIENESYSIQIINSLGQIINDVKLINSTSISNLKPGMYFYSLNNTQKTIKTGKFIVLGNSMK